MLSKCANPDCSAAFLYLRQGKLFRFEVKNQGNGKVRSEPEGSGTGGRSHTEYFWLCDSCLTRMTLVQHGDLEVNAVPLFSLKAAS
jgi:hypothetical protein